MRHFFKYLLIFLLTTLLTVPIGFYFGKLSTVSDNFHKFNLGIFQEAWQKIFSSSKDLSSPFVTQDIDKKYPLLKYSIPNLKKYQFQTSDLELLSLLAETDSYSSFVFSYQTMGKKMTGQINLPREVILKSRLAPVIIMIRGYVPLETYQTGAGTKNAAAEFAQAGYITIAPDFFGFGGSDAEPSDSWEARFIKPINIIELYHSIKTQAKIKVARDLTDDTFDAKEINLDPYQVGFWAHSNGGQIALTVLEVLAEPVPTTLWAPVTVPFPYSVLYFTDEMDDEGKESRAWLAKLEADYNVFEFTHTQYLQYLTGPIQIQHGTNDDAALIWWTEEFMQKIEQENKRRKEEQTNQPTPSSKANDALQSNDPNPANEEESLPTEPIEIIFKKYPGADHNLQPNWGAAVKKDLEFFEDKLKLVAAG